MRILVVDDNRSSADAIARALRRRGDEVTALYNGAEAIELIEAEELDLILTDYRMEPIDGTEVVRAARAARPPVDVIMFTAFGEVDVAVRAMRMGARDFLTKPVSLEQLMSRIDSLRESTASTGSLSPRAPSSGSTPAAAHEDDLEFIGVSQAGKDLHEVLQRVADVPTPVLVEGEVGVGRSYAARVLHRLSGRTGPLYQMPYGRPFEWPEHGTMLLPQVDELPMDVQWDLMQTLQSAPPTTRIVATASPNAAARVDEGNLRTDLYYHLAVVRVRVPPLRQRQEDILPLLDHALAMFARRYGRPLVGVPDDLARRILQHSWPGNVRELFNLAERAIVLGPETLDITPQAGSGSGDLVVPALLPGFRLMDHLEAVEKAILEEAQRRVEGDRGQMCEILGLERNTLRYKLNKYGLI